MRRISARPSTVRSAAEMTTAMFPSNGSPWDDCTPLARTWSSRVDFGPSQSMPHWPVMLPAADPHLELPERDHVLLDLEVPDERRDRHERRLQAGDREKAAAAEERVLVREAEHRVRAPLLAPRERDAVLADLERHRDRHLAVRGLHVDPRARERDGDVLPLQRGPHVVVREVRRGDVRLHRHLPPSLEALGDGRQAREILGERRRHREGAAPFAEVDVPGDARAPSPRAVRELSCPRCARPPRGRARPTARRRGRPADTRGGRPARRRGPRGAG